MMLLDMAVEACGNSSQTVCYLSEKEEVDHRLMMGEVVLIGGLNTMKMKKLPRKSECTIEMV